MRAAAQEREGLVTRDFRKRQTAPDAGPSRLRLAELGIMGAVILVFFGFVIEKVWELRAAAERLAVIQTVNAIRSSLGTEAMTQAIEGHTESLAALHHANPITLLTGKQDDKAPADDDGRPSAERVARRYAVQGSGPPPGYIGELDDPDPATIDGYQWYFDTSDQVLVYRVANDGYFSTTLAGVPRIRFQLQATYQDRNGNGRFDRAEDALERLNLEDLEDYHWDLQGSE